MQKTRTLPEVVYALRERGFDLSTKSSAFLGEDVWRRTETAGQSPWFVKLFAGIGAWIAGILFAAFVIASLPFAESEIGIFSFGLGLVLVALVMSRLSSSDGTFVSQLALAWSLAGQVLFLIGLMMTIDSNLGSEALIGGMYGLILLELVLLIFYRDHIQRVLSMLAITVALVVLLFEFEAFEAVHALTLVLAAIPLLLDTRRTLFVVEGLDDMTQAISQGALISLLLLLLIPLDADVTMDPLFDTRWWWLSALVLWVALLGLVALVGRDWGVDWPAFLQNLDSKQWPLGVLLGLLLLILIPAAQMPGLLAALLVLGWGYRHRNWTFVGLAIVFLGGYLGFYYYSLEWTLLTKSLSMLAVAALLFLIRFWLQYQFGRSA